MELKGIVYSVGKTQQVTETFKKRELILQIADNPTYPQFVKLETSQDRVALFDGLIIGQEIIAAINIQGRLWTDRLGEETAFNTLSVWKVTKLGDAPVPLPVDISGGDSDNLPF